MRSLILFLALSFCTALTAQQVGIASAGVFSGSGPSYTGTFSNWIDVYESGYETTAVATGDMFADAEGREYEITSVTSTTFNSVNVVVNCLSVPSAAPSGTGQAWRPLENGQYPIAPDGSGQIGEFLQALLLTRNFTKGAASGGAEAGLVYRDTTMSIAGLSVNLSVSGSGPSLSGAAGSYTITVPSGANVQGITLSGSASATSSNDLSLTISGEARQRSTTLIDGGNNQVISAPKLEYGILTTQVVSGSGSTHQYAGIGGLSSFTIHLTR